MSEIDYKICQIIKKHTISKGEYPNINHIARRILYSREGTRYHLNKLIKLGIIAKNDDSTYKLIVTTLK